MRNKESLNTFNESINGNLVPTENNFASNGISPFFNAYDNNIKKESSKTNSKHEKKEINREQDSKLFESERNLNNDSLNIQIQENTNANANTARKNNADKMNTMIDVLRQAGLTDENITTSSFQITPNYDYENSNYDRIISYTALNKVELKTSASANISKFIDLAVNNGANRVENIDFVISKKTLDENSIDLLKEAFRDAKQKAEVLASEGNFTVAGVKKN